MKLKYILFINYSKLPRVIIFDICQSHNEVAQSHKELTPTSAGFCGFDMKGQLKCWGDSITLGLKSNENDVKTIERLMSL